MNSVLTLVDVEPELSPIFFENLSVPPVPVDDRARMVKHCTKAVGNSTLIDFSEVLALPPFPRKSVNLNQFSVYFVAIVPLP